MSSGDRKIGFYNFIFTKASDGNQFFDKDLFKDFFDYINNLPSDDKIIRNDSKHKAISIEGYTVMTHNTYYATKIIFKSCKFNHRPPLMSSIDGSERNSDKKPQEGEKEKTHLCMHIHDTEAELILEERKNGVTIHEIVKYLNSRLRKYLEQKRLKPEFAITHGIVPSEAFLENLKSMTRVSIAEVFTGKKILGSEFLNLYEHEDSSMRNDVMITLKSKRSENLFKRHLKAIYERLIGQDEIITRIRIYGADEEGKHVKLDSDIIKKVDYINTLLDENGIVQTSTMFEKMETLLGADD
jgi:hypothetical protein